MSQPAQNPEEDLKYPKPLMWGLVILRVAVGWHFLYEGITKLLEPNWTAAAFLAESRWFVAPLFRWILANPLALELTDQLNMWGLTLIGLALILGCFTRIASLSGAALLFLYYVASPPLIGMGSPRAEGNYLLIDKNLIELMLLCVFAAIPTGRFLGLDHLIHAWRKRKADAQATPEPQPSPLLLQRRHLLVRSFATLPVLGGFAWEVARKREYDSFEEKHLLSAKGSLDGMTTATTKTFHFANLKELKGRIPTGRIKNLEVSRLIAGGNLIGGWAHSRDLIYVSKLIKAYHTDEKVFETLSLAEQCGINTLLTNPQLSRVINKYRRTRGGKIQFISDCAFGDDVIKGIDLSIEGGADACYIQGGISDKLYKEGKIDQIAKALEHIRQSGVPAGIGAHLLGTVQECVRLGMKPDFWVKTLHRCDYWSARVGEEENDNIWCTDPEEVMRFMSSLEEPWIAFKVLAAGSIEPKHGFKFALEGGADFICVGMYDFQVVEDANVALDTLASCDAARTRPWRA